MNKRGRGGHRDEGRQTEMRYSVITIVFILLNLCGNKYINLMSCCDTHLNIFRCRRRPHASWSECLEEFFLLRSSYEVSPWEAKGSGGLLGGSASFGQ